MRGVARVTAAWSRHAAVWVGSVHRAMRRKRALRQAFRKRMRRRAEFWSPSACSRREWCEGECTASERARALDMFDLTFSPGAERENGKRAIASKSDGGAEIPRHHRTHVPFLRRLFSRDMEGEAWEEGCGSMCAIRSFGTRFACHKERCRKFCIEDSEEIGPAKWPFCTLFCHDSVVLVRGVNASPQAEYRALWLRCYCVMPFVMLHEMEQLLPMPSSSVTGRRLVPSPPRKNGSAQILSLR